jgi:hypothetical protein
MTSDDRREFQRLHLAKPILSQFGEANALILDIGVGGALIEHHGPAESWEERKLRFRWKGEEVELTVEVIRSRVVRELSAMQTVTSHTGVRFLDLSRAAAELLNDMMATFVGKVLSAQRANASGKGGGPDALILAQIGGARRSRSQGWMSYRWVQGAWHIAPTSSPLQPQDGFTVAAYEDEDELLELCETYEASNDESRRLIRLVAELSAMNVKVK